MNLAQCVSPEPPHRIDPARVVAYVDPKPPEGYVPHAPTVITHLKVERAQNKAPRKPRLSDRAREVVDMIRKAEKLAGSKRVTVDQIAVGTTPTERRRLIVMIHDLVRRKIIDRSGTPKFFRYSVITEKRASR